MVIHSLVIGNGQVETRKRAVNALIVLKKFGLLDIYVVTYKHSKLDI